MTFLDKWLNLGKKFELTLSKEDEIKEEVTNEEVIELAEVKDEDEEVKDEEVKDEEVEEEEVEEVEEEELAEESEFVTKEDYNNLVESVKLLAEELAKLINTDEEEVVEDETVVEQEEEVKEEEKEEEEKIDLSKENDELKNRIIELEKVSNAPMESTLDNEVVITDDMTYSERVKTRITNIK